MKHRAAARRAKGTNTLVEGPRPSFITSFYYCSLTVFPTGSWLVEIDPKGFLNKIIDHKLDTSMHQGDFAAL